MAKREKIGVTMRAVIQRINRKLAPDDEVLRAARSERMRMEYGDYYVIGTRVGGVNEKNIDPETMARELGVLHPWEEVWEDAR
jgi:hypothetical protein